MDDSKLKSPPPKGGKGAGPLGRRVAILGLRLRIWLKWIRRKFPPGARTLIGIVLIALGTVGFLPVVGFWMIPSGIAILSLDLLAV